MTKLVFTFGFAVLLPSVLFLGLLTMGTGAVVSAGITLPVWLFAVNRLF